MQLDAPFCQLDRKRRGMGSLSLAVLNRFVGNEPGVAAATFVAAAGVCPAGDVAFVLIRNAEGQPINFDATRLREMKNVFVAIV